MGFTRRKFLTTAALGGVGAALSSSGLASNLISPAKKTTDASVNPTYEKLDKILREPVLKREQFTLPVIIETLELLRYKDNFLCRVRSKDGVEGFSFGQNDQLKSLYPIFVTRMQEYFIGKDARDLESLLEEVYVFKSNYKLQGIAIWVPLATIEFAILDMLGKIANMSIGALIGTVQTSKINVYQANSERYI